MLVCFDLLLRHGNSGFVCRIGLLLEDMYHGEVSESEPKCRGAEKLMVDLSIDLFLIGCLTLFSTPDWTKKKGCEVFPYLRFKE